MQCKYSVSTVCLLDISVNCIGELLCMKRCSYGEEQGGAREEDCWSTIVARLHPTPLLSTVLHRKLIESCPFAVVSSLHCIHSA